MERLLVIKKSRLLIFFVIFINSLEGFSQNSKASFNINGYVKYLPSYMDYSFFDSEINNLIHNRINVRGYFSENFSIGLEVRNRILFGDIPVIQSDLGLVDMSYFVIENSNFVFHSMIDRLWLKYQKDKIEINVGRQRVNSVSYTHLTLPTNREV